VRSWSLRHTEAVALALALWRAASLCARVRACAVVPTKHIYYIMHTYIQLAHPPPTHSSHVCGLTPATLPTRRHPRSTHTAHLSPLNKRKGNSAVEQHQPHDTTRTAPQTTTRSTPPPRTSQQSKVVRRGYCEQSMPHIYPNI